MTIKVVIDHCLTLKTNVNKKSNFFKFKKKKSDCENANISGYHWWVKGDIKSGAEIGLLGHP